MARNKAPRLTMTVTELYYAMREVGIPCSPRSISDGIASGAYPFGRIVCVGEGGRRRIEVFKVDFLAWLRTRIPNDSVFDELRESLPAAPCPETKRTAMPASTAATAPIEGANPIVLLYNAPVPLSREGMKFG